MADDRDLDELGLEELEKLLKPKQIKFVLAYEQCGNATEAAVMAGYCVAKDGTVNKRAAAVTGCRLLRDANVSAYRRALTRELYNTANISKESLTLKALKVFEQSMEGSPRLVWSSVEHTYVPDGTWNFNDRGANGALEIIAKLGGLLTDRVRVETPGGVEAYLKALEAQKEEDGAAGGEF